MLVWAHEITGMASICALSDVYPGGTGSGCQGVMLSVLDRWFEQGFAMMAPDYQGQGTLGGHPWTVSQLVTPDRQAMLDMARSRCAGKAGRFAMKA